MRHKSKDIFNDSKIKIIIKGTVIIIISETWFICLIF